SDEDDEDSELTPAYWGGEDLADDTPYIEKVVGHRVIDDGELTVDATRDDFEYNIKWEGKSHLHNTWDPMDTLRGYRGTTKKAAETATTAKSAAKGETGAGAAMMVVVMVAAQGPAIVVIVIVVVVVGGGGGGGAAAAVSVAVAAGQG
ncbi:hypothetical protein JX266_007791, partial [Neoarthrinium moseri]